jgi:catechol 2,3-dioxygenase-like lactoylglutathione lyase family enzyme
VVLFSKNLSRTAEFYKELGFEEAFRTPSEGPPIHVDLVLDGYRIGLASEDSTRNDHGLVPSWTAIGPLSFCGQMTHRRRTQRFRTSAHVPSRSPRPGLNGSS